MEKFKPCAFCGGIASPFMDNYNNFGVQCENCGLYLGVELENGVVMRDGWRAKYKTREEALSVWNQRPSQWATSLCPHGYKDWDDCPDCCH